MTKAEKQATYKSKGAHAKARRAIARELESLPGYGGLKRVTVRDSRTKTGYRIVKLPYRKAAVGTHRLRYINKSKRGGRIVEQKLKKGGTRVIQVIDPKILNEFNELRVGRRAGKPDKGRGHGSGPKPGWYNEWKGKKGGRKATAPAAARGRRGGARGRKGTYPGMVSYEGAPVMAAQYATNNISALVPVRRNGSALYPVRHNGLSLTKSNPSIAGVGNFLLGYAIPVTVAGGVAGAAHAALSGFGVTSKISDTIAMIPVVGEKVAEYAPFTIQGLLFGSLASAALGLAGVASGQTMSAAKAAGLVVGSLFVTGAGLDLFYFVSGMQESAADADDEAGISDEIDAEMSNVEAEAEAVGGLSLNQYGALAEEIRPFASSLGDGMAFETASLTATPNCGVYGQASLADALYCGADFSVEEGQALLNGQAAYENRFGAPPVRMSSRIRKGPSHFAGRPGMRWLWLVKFLGWNKTQKIASLPPGTRIATIKKMRQAAIDAFNQAMAEVEAAESQILPQPSEVVPAAGTIPGAPEGATNYLGDPALFTA